MKRHDLVLEIGPGDGILTCELARACRWVVAVEKDARMASAARQRTEPFGNVEIVDGDILEYPLPGNEYKVVANLPFNTTAAIIDRLTNASPPPVECYLLVQREAAERFAGDPRTTLVSVLAHPWWSISIVDQFRRSDFVPRPRVDTVLMAMKLRESPLVDADDAALFRDFVTFGFTAWEPSVRIAYRKVLRGNARILLEEMGVDIDRRPSQIAVDDWLKLFHVFMDSVPRSARRVVCGSHDRLKSQQASLAKCHRSRTRRYPQR